MFFSPTSILFLIPAIIYLIVIGLLIWLVVRLVRSNEEIALHTGKIAKALNDKNEIERRKMEG